MRQNPRRGEGYRTVSVSDSNTISPLSFAYFTAMPSARRFLPVVAVFIMGMLLVVLYFDHFHNPTFHNREEWFDKHEEPAKKDEHTQRPKSAGNGERKDGAGISSERDTRNRDSETVIATPPVDTCTQYDGGQLKPCKHRIGKMLQATDGEKLHLAVVACGGVVVEAVVLLKSAVTLTTKSHVVFHIFSELNQLSFFEKELNAWPESVLERVEYRLYVTTYPDAMKKWKDKFGACASQRLLFPLLLKDVDAVVYLDADALLLSPLDKMWNYFSHFNSTQMLALAPEHEDTTVSWYHQHSQIPFFRPSGLNSGVLLMNLTRLREVNFTGTIVQYEQEYGKKLAWFDQDLFNIFCHFHPDRLYQLNCSVNYRGDHCTDMHRIPKSACKSAEEHGVSVLHGSKRAFHKLSPFIVVQNSFREFKLGSSLTTLLDSMKAKLAKTRYRQCGFMYDAFLKHIVELVKKVQPS
ncbi:glucoside xylosyltransferase 1-like [Littorina saxatilis]|uniref:glucoside xylosyltransferase 1-like n=1 Tax=Littorina saxatilis TaxID=31220 RepID=UPI0038B50FEE